MLGAGGALHHNAMDAIPSTWRRPITPAAGGNLRTRRGCHLPSSPLAAGVIAHWEVVDGASQPLTHLVPALLWSPTIPETCLSGEDISSALVWLAARQGRP
jgi:hypothetical protein